MSKMDSEIQQAVLDELRWDTRIRAASIGVEVDSSVVTLTGTVDNFAQRAAAQEAAHRVHGVLDVANDIEIEVPATTALTDGALAARVRHALEWDVLVPAERIRSTVSDGWVTLRGEVDYWSQRDDAALAIRNLAGVKGVTNSIDVTPPLVFPAEVERSIEDALARRAQRTAQHVSVGLQHDTVILRGVVRSAAERDLVLGAVTGTHGVKHIDNQIRIDTLAR